MKLANPFKLKALGIVGMNARNVDCIQKHNRRKFYPLVDDKVITKTIAENAGLTVPKLYSIIQCQYEVKNLEKRLQRFNDFVIKPSKGSGGNGILVITGKQGDLFVKPNGKTVNIDDIKRHISNILSGLYSLGGQPDKAMIEYRVHFSEFFKDISYQGVPDIRVIVFLGFPIMAMTRLPTSESDGKANLHQGAIGVGIDISTGKTLGGVQNNRPISVHPDTQNSFQNLIIPKWDTLLEISAGCYEIAKLGYLGVDIVLDKNIGPMILELNARPGLAIQIANDLGLNKRLSVIKNAPQHLNVQQRIKFSKDNFTAI